MVTHAKDYCIQSFPSETNCRHRAIALLLTRAPLPTLPDLPTEEPHCPSHCHGVSSENGDRANSS